MRSDDCTFYEWMPLLCDFVDDYSRKTWIYFMKAKSETFAKFQEFKTFIEKQMGMHIRALRFHCNLQRFPSYRKVPVWIFSPWVHECAQDTQRSSDDLLQVSHL